MERGRHLSTYVADRLASVFAFEVFPQTITPDLPVHMYIGKVSTNVTMICSDIDRSWGCHYLRLIDMKNFVWRVRLLEHILLHVLATELFK